MISFYFTSLSFKPALKTPRRLYIRIELPDGSSKTTETTTYNVDSNIAVFSEVFEFVFSNPTKVAYFNLEIHEYNPETPNKKQIVGKTSLHTSSKFFNDDNKVTLQSSYSSELTLYFTLDAPEETKAKIINSSTNLPQAVKPGKENTKEEGLSYSTGQLDFLKLGPLFYDFVLAVSPLVLVLEKLHSFFMWTNPHETLLYSAVFMMVYFYYRGLAVVFFLVFFRYSSLVITEALKAKPLQETAETKLQIYKRNLLFIQHIMEITVQVNDFYKKIFHDYDKSAIMEIFVKVRRFSLILALLLIMYNMNHLLIMSYWGFLFYNTTYGKIIFTLGYEKVEKVIDVINNLILGLVKADAPASREASPLKEPRLTVESAVGSSDTLREKIIPNQKTFITYENQRWWLGKGWCDQMLIGERSAWSDYQGNISLPKENFNLPSAQWRWHGGWEVTITPQTDQEGWEYAIEFTKPFHSKGQVFDYVRRRRWTRKCVQDMTEN